MDALIHFVLKGCVPFSQFLDDFVVGIDVSSEFSIVAILAPTGEFTRKLFRIDHNPASFHKLLNILIKKEERLNRKPIYFVESTGIFHLPLFFFKSNDLKGFVLNPLCIHSTKNFDLRKVKNDNKYVQAIARLAKYQNVKVSMMPEPQILALRMMTREYYTIADMLTDQSKCVSKKKNVALVAVTHKLPHYIFAVLRDQKPFEFRKPVDHQTWRKTKSQTEVA